VSDAVSANVELTFLMRQLRPLPVTWRHKPKPVRSSSTSSAQFRDQALLELRTQTLLERSSSEVRFSTNVIADCESHG
jgi:hypothetical protein